MKFYAIHTWNTYNQQKGIIDIAYSADDWGSEDLDEAIEMAKREAKSGSWEKVEVAQINVEDNYTDKIVWEWYKDETN